MKAWLSLRGLYEWDPTVLDSLQLPAGVDRDMLVPQLLIDSQDLEVLFPDPASMKYAVRVWSTSRLKIWTELYKSTTFEYNPIYNYDRTETETIDRTREGNGTNTRSGSQNTARTGNQTDEQSGKVTTDVKDYVAGFNDSSATADTAKEHTVTEVTPTNSKETLTYNNVKDTTTFEDVKDTNDFDETSGESRTLRAFGNIGTMTTAYMIQEYRDISEFDIYRYIIEDFQKRFCLLVF